MARRLRLGVFVSAAPDYTRDLLPSMVLTGVGVGLTLGTLIAAGVQSLPGARTATGSALVSSFRQVSSALGVAILIILIGSRVTAGSVGDFRLAWAVGAVLAAVTAGLGALLTRPSVTTAAAPVPDRASSV